ncbi:MAG: DUF429 domain-containing protein [Cyanobacteria bacterium P01_D01_bin.105]
MRFIGVDLGWQSGASGVCCLAWDAGALAIRALDRQETVEDVLLWLDEMAPADEPAIIAVDAPTLIPNATGMRVPDRLAHKYFGKYHAGCYPANLGRPFAARLVKFGQDLEARGFVHAPTIEPKKAGRYQVEVFPHPAMVQLFNLPRILKYKKGRLAERRVGLEGLRSHILTHLPEQDPPLFIQDLPPIPETGKALKALEDKLDSIVCAYVAAHWWMWGRERNQVLGSCQDGYIVVPCLPNAPVPKSAFEAHSSSP